MTPPFKTSAIVAALLALFPVEAALAAPGELVSAVIEKTMAPKEVDDFIAKLYRGYEAPAARYSVDIYGIKFRSVYPDGTPAVAFAQVFIPRFEGERTRTRPLYVFGPGSTGLTDNCRPSREHVVGIRWGLYRAHVLSHAGQGTVGIIPDYLGFGDPDREQYYMVAEAEAAVMLDSIRSARALIARERFAGIDETAAFVGGFSQGGHAAFAAADYRSSYAPEIRLFGVIGYGPSTDLIALFKEFPDVAPMALYTFRNLYGVAEVDPTPVLSKTFAPTLDSDVTRQCVGGMQSYYPIDPKKLFSPKFASALLGGRLKTEFPGVYRALAKNTVGLTKHGVPALIMQGTDDIVVSVASQQAFAEAIKANGGQVDLRIMKGVRHDTRQAAFEEVQTWMKSKLDAR